MLKKNKCQYCFQKNEKIWDEQSWKEGFIECPYEELYLIFKGHLITTNDPYYNLLYAIYCSIETNEDPPDFCMYQKENFKKYYNLKPNNDDK